MVDPLLQALAELLKVIRPEFDFTSDADFINDGMLDSFDMIALVDALDRRYGISIDGEDIVPDHFSSLSAIAALLRKYGVA